MSEIQSSALAQALADKPQDAALEQALQRPYQHGFVTDSESESLPPGLNEDTIRSISRIKREPQFLLDWRLAAFKRWQAMPTPDWAHLQIAPIDLQALSYYSAPKSLKDKPKSLDEVDPKLLETYEKLNVPLHERARLAGVAVDAVFDSVSVGTTFREQLAAVDTPAGTVRIEGRIAPGLARLYEFESAASGAIRQNLDIAAYARETGSALRPLVIVQLDGAADGLQRQWTPVAADVSKHHGYALQWFSLSALITGLYVWFQLIRPWRRRTR